MGDMSIAVLSYGDINCDNYLVNYCTTVLYLSAIQTGLIITPWSLPVYCLGRGGYFRGSKILFFLAEIIKVTNFNEYEKL